MKVLVDVTTWCPGRTGVGLYTEHVLRSWLALGQDELILATNTDDREFLDVAAQKIGPRMPIRAAWMQTALAYQAAKLRPDAAFFPNYMAPLSLAAGVPKIPYVVTVHDLAIFLYPETFTFKKRVLQRLLLPTLARGAAAILTPSEATRRDVLRILPVHPENVIAVPLAADARFHTPPDELTVARERQNLKLPRHFLLAVGTLEPRKNLVRLIEAFEHIAPAHPDVHLVLAGVDAHLVTVRADLARRRARVDRLDGHDGESHVGEQVRAKRADAHHAHDHEGQRDNYGEDWAPDGDVRERHGATRGPARGRMPKRVGRLRRKILKFNSSAKRPQPARHRPPAARHLRATTHPDSPRRGRSARAQPSRTVSPCPCAAA